MTEQTVHIPAHARSLILAAAQEAASVVTWTDREKLLSGLYTKHQEDANEELGALAAQIDELRVAFEARRAVLGEQGQRIASELADAGRRKDQHFEDAQDARQTLLDWCARRGVDPATLPTVTATESSGPLPVVSTGPQGALPSGVEVATAEEIRERFDLHRGELRPVLPDGDTTTTRADMGGLLIGGEAPEAPFHPGDPDSDDTGRIDA